jgi:O-antigen/teichoic acid export membrane protein
MQAASLSPAVPSTPTRTRPPATHEFQARIQPSSCSVWHGFQWATIGNLVYAFSQFAILIILAQVGTPRHVGQYALALAVASPVVLFSNLQLRAILASDATRRHHFSEYWRLRMLTAPFACAVVAIIAFCGSFGFDTAVVIAIAAAAKSIETFSDLCYGACQRNQRLDLVGKSLVMKGIASVLALGVLTWATQSVAIGVAGIGAVWLGLLLGYDLPHVRRGDAAVGWPNRPEDSGGWITQKQLIALGLPLGISISLLSLSVALPSILVERYLGEHEVGIFAAFSGLAWAGIPLINAIGQTALPKLGEFYCRQDRHRLRRVVAALAVAGAGLGIAGIVAAQFAGSSIVTLVYGSEYAKRADVLMWLLAAAAALFAARFIGDALTAMRCNKIQLTSQAFVALVVLVGGWAVLPQAGLAGMAQVLTAAFAMRVVILAACFSVESGKLNPAQPVLSVETQNATV